MLHEVLLALSGHPSPLFKYSDSSQLPNDALSSDGSGLLSPSEIALLSSIGQLSELHRKLRQHLEQISLNHASTICRAVATSIRQTHLTRFQDRILAVERKILTKDTSIVGAYDIVPLAGVVGEFEDWHRRMAWYWDIACFMQPISSLDAVSHRSTGTSLIDRLRIEQQTGFSDVEEAAIELSKVAETAWLRQLASWLLYGKLAAFGSEDFFIQLRPNSEAGTADFFKDKDLIPKFVSTPTASSIMFIGRSLHQVWKYGQDVSTLNGGKTPRTSESELVSAHLARLSSLSMPVAPAQLSRAISAIRLSLSQNVLKRLLPMESTLTLLSCLRQYFLLGRSDFAIMLINEAANRVQARQQGMGRLLQQDPVKALQGLTISDAEFQQTLSQTWKALGSQDYDVEDDVLDFGRKMITLSTPEHHSSRPPTSDSVHGASVDMTPIGFNDLLFPNAVCLGLHIARPLDLLITQTEVEIYSAINAYLLGLRRARLRLSDLWRRTPARRDYPAPVGEPVEMPEAKERIVVRRVTARKVWATCTAAMFLLSETSAYFEGEIIRESWDHFERWVKQPASSEQSREPQIQEGHLASGGVSPRDPETLAAGHRSFLASLTYVLLLNDVPYTKELRSLLGNVDSLIAFFDRLLGTQQKLDVERDAGGETAYTMGEEQRTSLELDRARKKVDSDLKSVVNRLRQLDNERIGYARSLNTSSLETGFDPWKGGGVDRLLMKLEFGRMADERFDIV